MLHVFRGVIFDCCKPAYVNINTVVAFPPSSINALNIGWHRISFRVKQHFSTALQILATFPTNSVYISVWHRFSFYKHTADSVTKLFCFFMCTRSMNSGFWCYYFTGNVRTVFHRNISFYVKFAFISLKRISFQEDVKLFWTQRLS